MPEGHLQRRLRAAPGGWMPEGHLQSGAVEHIGVEQRRARLAVRHHLAGPAPSAEQVADDLVGFHATDPVSLFVSAWARTTDVSIADFEHVLYERRSLVRTLGMRRTMFVVPLDVLPVVETAAGHALAGPERRRLVGWLEEAAVSGAGETWLRAVEDDAVRELEKRGPSTAQELATDVPALQLRFTVGQGKKYEATISLGTRVLLILAMEGRILRGRPRGSWLSTQYRWAARRDWIGDVPNVLDVEEASAALVQRWLRAFGPATFEDLKWWTGWTVRQTRGALSRLEVVEVDLDGMAGLLLADDLDSQKQPDPWIALLPALDATVMGWKHRDWYLGEYRGVLFDRNGNAGPSVWCDGRIVGGWAQRPNGDIAVRILEDIGRDAVAAVEERANQLCQWFGDTRFKWRFPTPLQRELDAG
jgi:hypothetical protein